MCCFTGKISHVSSTHIFARRTDSGHQYLVYSMRVTSADDVAMILPLPTPAKTKEDDVQFIDLRGYTLFFKDLEKGFEPPPRPKEGGFGGGGGGFRLDEPKPKLKVIEVGAFEASFVPRIADFERLDERFRLPKEVWAKLPAYQKFGFAVFKLKAGRIKAPPMALRFPTALEKDVFFPTVHIHDGEVHKQASFDHALYAQVSPEQAMYADGWEESAGLAESFMSRKRAGKIVDFGQHVYKKSLLGVLKNADTLV